MANMAISFLSFRAFRTIAEFLCAGRSIEPGRVAAIWMIGRLRGFAGERG
jgi:hypothetical protein